MRKLCVILLLLLAMWPARGAEKFPPRPAAYLNDYASVIPREAARALDDELRQFERDTSNQIVVAIFPKLESTSSVQDFTVRVAESWKVGQAGKDNGAVLFVFIADRQMFIQVGYGLEGALPDITCKQIIENEIKPQFRTGDYAAGVGAGIQAMMAATRGEYQGSGRVAGGGSTGVSMLVLFFAALLSWLVFSTIRSSWKRGVVYSRSGRSFAAGFLINMVSTLFGSSSSGGGGGGWSSGGGGGFSGGGGSFGGGGAGGSW